ETGRPNHCWAASRGEVGRGTPEGARSSRMASIAFVSRSVRLLPGLVARPTEETLEGLLPKACHWRSKGPKGWSRLASAWSPTSWRIARTWTLVVAARRALSRPSKVVAGGDAVAVAGAVGVTGMVGLLVGLVLIKARWSGLPFPVDEENFL